MVRDMNDNDILLRINNLKTYFYLREGVVRAVDGATLSVRRGKTLGVVGESGCGKSVTAQSILQIVPRPGLIVEGEITLFGDGDGGGGEDAGVNITALGLQSAEMRSIRGSDIGMIFQEPMTSFSPVHTIGDQLAETILLHNKVAKDVSKSMAIEMMNSVGIANAERNYMAYPHQLSGGMRQRAMIAMALMLRPKLLIADEPTTALDVTTEAQILRLMRELQRKLGMAIMFITHDLGVIAEMADEVAVMYLGRVVECADVDTIFYGPKHPYLVALLRSVPRIGVEAVSRLATIEGMVPNPLDIPAGCPFHTRCTEVMTGLCDVEIPAYIELEPGHKVACHLYNRNGQRDE